MQLQNKLFVSVCFVGEHLGVFDEDRIAMSVRRHAEDSG
jgi:hypothetical protein